MTDKFVECNICEDFNGFKGTQSLQKQLIINKLVALQQQLLLTEVRDQISALKHLEQLLC